MGKQWKQWQTLLFWSLGQSSAKSFIPHPSWAVPALPHWTGSVLWGYYFPCALCGSWRWGRPPPSASTLILSEYRVSRHSWDFLLFRYLTFRVSSVTPVWSLSGFKLHTGDLSDTFLLETFSSLGFQDNTHPYSPSSFLAAPSSSAVRVSFSSSTPQPLIVRRLSPWTFFFFSYLFTP